MKKWAWVAALAVIVVLVIVLSRGGSAEGDIRRLIEEAQTAAVNEANRENSNALDNYFATVEEGVQEGGLAETQAAYQNFVTQLRGDTVQVHSFNIEGVEVHENGGLARVSYQAHVSIVRGGAAVFTVRFRQNLALLKTATGWRVSGGDAPQIEETTGVWPPR